VTRGVSPAELRRLYQRERLAVVEIGERFGVSGRTVHGWLRQLGIAPRPRSERRRRHRRPAPVELRRGYVADGLSTGQLAKRYGVSASTVTRWLKDAGIPRRPAGRRSQAPAREELCRLYQAEGLSTAQIGERYGVSQQTAHRWVRAAGVPLRPQGQPTRASTGRPGPSPEVRTGSLVLEDGSTRAAVLDAAPADATPAAP
jgi:transposase